MSLAFNVANAGPLSQIGFDLSSFGTAVYLATHAYGWYQSRNRAQTLEQVLSSSGVSLASVSTFNKITYTNTRQKYGGVWGAAVREEDGILTRFRMPKASTALEGDPGLVCLRALVVGLLCFVREPQICTILKTLLPRRLFNYELEGDAAKIEDVCLASVSQFIQAVAQEEAVDDLCKHLREFADAQILRVSNATSDQVLMSQHSEIGHVIGFLDWQLTPLATRRFMNEAFGPLIYTTRSLKVWCLALVLSELGFEVEASRQPISEWDSEQKGGHLQFSQHHYFPEVTLALTTQIPTDQGLGMVPGGHLDFSAQVRAPPRIIPVRAFPAVFYAEYISSARYSKGHCVINARILEEVFLDTFSKVRDRLSNEPYLCRAAGMDELGSNAPVVKPKSYVPSHINELLAPYIGSASKSKWYAERGDILTEYSWILLEPVINEHFEPKRKGKSLMRRDDFDQLVPKHIISATILAAISMFVRPKGDKTETALDMDFVYTEYLTVEGEHRLHTWFSTMIRTLLVMQALYGGDLCFPPLSLESRHLARGEWANLLAQVLTGADTGSKPIDGAHGAQNHGLAIVSDFLMQPTPDMRSTFRYHCIRGQLLHFPTKGGFIVEGPPETEPPSRHTVSVLTREDLESPPPASLNHIRMDAEPCWEGDVQEVCLNIRVAGRPILRLNPSPLIEGCQDNQHHRIDCKCMPDRPCLGLESTIKLFLDDLPGGTHSLHWRWYTFPFFQMVEESQMIIPIKTRPDQCRPWASSSSSYLFCTHGHDVLLMLGLAIFPTLSRAQIIVTSCIGAALIFCLRKQHPKGSSPRQSFVVILHQEPAARPQLNDPFYDAAQLVEETCYLRPEQQLAMKKAITIIYPGDGNNSQAIIEILIDARSSGSISKDGVIAVLRALDSEGILSGTEIVHKAEQQIKTWQQTHPEYIPQPLQLRQEPPPIVYDARFNSIHPLQGWYSSAGS